jgi:argininosuccinate synthase
MLSTFDAYLPAADYPAGTSVVLGFSGGLDTSFCAALLALEKKWTVHSVTINTGGFSPEELQAIEARAYALGVASHITIDAIQPYYDQIIRFLIYGNVLKNQTYPLSVSAERLIQARQLVAYAKQQGINVIAHGSTGAGNDQVRFDLIFQVEMPGVQIITPIRDLRLSRDAELDYLEARGIPVQREKAAYSINKGLWGTSVGGRETLTSEQFLPESAWPTPVTATTPRQIKLLFENGEPVALDGMRYAHPVELIQALQALAGPYGIGRDIHVGDTIIGLKGRVGFEAAAPVILLKAHYALEKHVLTKWQLQWKEQLASFYGNYLHEGLILDPVMRDIEAFFQNSQQRVSGNVFVELHPHRFQVLGVDSPYDMMRSPRGQYGEMNSGWTGTDVRGFTTVYGNALQIYHAIKPTGDDN